MTDTKNKNTIDSFIDNYQRYKNYESVAEDAFTEIDVSVDSRFRFVKDNRQPTDYIISLGANETDVSSIPNINNLQNVVSAELIGGTVTNFYNLAIDTFNSAKRQPFIYLEIEELENQLATPIRKGNVFAKIRLEPSDEELIRFNRDNIHVGTALFQPPKTIQKLRIIMRNYQGEIIDFTGEDGLALTEIVVTTNETTFTVEADHGLVEDDLIYLQLDGGITGITDELTNAFNNRDFDVKTVPSSTTFTIDNFQPLVPVTLNAANTKYGYLLKHRFQNTFDLKFTIKDQDRSELFKNYTLGADQSDLFGPSKIEPIPFDLVPLQNTIDSLLTNFGSQTSLLMEAISAMMVMEAQKSDGNVQDETNILAQQALLGSLVDLQQKQKALASSSSSVGRTSSSDSRSVLKPPTRRDAVYVGRREDIRPVTDSAYEQSDSYIIEDGEEDDNDVMESFRSRVGVQHKMQPFGKGSVYNYNPSSQYDSAEPLDETYYNRSSYRAKKKSVNDNEQMKMSSSNYHKSSQTHKKKHKKKHRKKESSAARDLDDLYFTGDVESYRRSRK